MRRFLLILAVIIFTFNSCIRCNKKNIEQHNITNIKDNTPENYIENCQYLLKNKITLPTENVSHGVIFKNWKQDYGIFIKGQSFTIDSVFISQFKDLTSDSNNFQWGELGTPYWDYKIEFCDKNNTIINIANISYDGMITTEPRYVITKWGVLTTKGENELKILMNKYTNRH